MRLTELCELVQRFNESIQARLATSNAFVDRIASCPDIQWRPKSVSAQLSQRGTTLTQASTYPVPGRLTILTAVPLPDSIEGCIKG